MVSKQWTVEPLNATVRREIRTLPVDMIDEFVRISRLIEEHGIEFVSMPHVRHIRGPLWEMRLRGRSGISRALYMTVHERRVVVLRVFTKKTQRTPKREIELAMRRAQEIDK